MRNSTLHNWRTDAFPLCSVPMRVHLLRLAWRDRPKSMVVIGVSTDDSEAAAKAYLRQSNATLNHFIDQDLAVETCWGPTDSRGRFWSTKKVSLLASTMATDNGTSLRRSAGLRLGFAKNSV